MVDALEVLKLVASTQDTHELWGYRGRMVLALRGSQTRSDWTSNLRFDLTDHLVLGPTHTGFLASAQEIVGTALLVATERPLVVVGYSRGGAVGIVLAALLKAAGRPPVEVVTFGAPKAGVRLGEALGDIPVRQYALAGDPVPEWPDPPYAHVAPLQVLGLQLRLFGRHQLISYLEALSDGQTVEKSPAGFHAHAPA